MCNSKGSILAITVGFALVFTMLGIASIYTGTLQSVTQEKQILSQKAFWLAEAGLQKALWGFNKNGIKTFSDSISNSGDYDATIDAANTTITSDGYSPHRKDPLNPEEFIAGRFIEATIGPGSPFRYAIFGDVSVSLGQHFASDSYNSVNGPYGGSNVGNNGDIGSNDTTILGQYDPSDIKGDIVENTNINLPVVDVPLNLKNLSSGGVYSVSGKKIISSGSYRYDYINIANNGALTINGNVVLYLSGSGSGGQALLTNNNPSIIIGSTSSLTIYVDNKISLKNNVIVNQAGAPQKFTVYSTYSGTGGVDVNNNANFYGAVYAPRTDISLKNNNTVYGSLIGDSVVVNNNDTLHYDDTLGLIQGPSWYTLFRINSWKEEQKI
jgi:hypothetical protein